MTVFFRDLRHAVRQLFRRPAFSIASISILALGMSGTISLSTIVKGALIDPWPYEGYRRLVSVAATYPRMAHARLGTWSVPEILDLERQTQVFDGVIEGIARNLNVTDGAEPERIHAVAMNSGAFSALGAAPALGRTFSPEEDRPGAPKVAVLSDRIWRRRFGADPAVVGRAISIEGTPHTVVGIMPPRFLWWDAQIYFPLALDRGDLARSRRDLYFQARLRPGVSLSSAEAALDGLLRRWERVAGSTAPEYHGAHFRLARMVDQVLRDVKPVLWVLLTAVAVVFLVAGANVANLLGARAARREREIAIRRAVGADSAQIAGLFLAEAFVLSSAAGAVAFAASRAVVAAILSAIPRGYIPAEADIRVGGAAFGLAAALVLASTLLLGLAPILEQRSGSALSSRLAAAGLGRSGSRRIFVGSQVAAAIAVVTVAGLLVENFRRLVSLPTGVAIERVLTMRIALPRDPAERPSDAAATFEEILRRVEGLPSVDSAGAVSSLPLQDAPEVRLSLEGRGAERNGTVFEADSLVAAGHYFTAAGIALRRGRVFDARDSAEAPAVALINQTMAARFFPGEDPVGKRLRLEGSGNSPWRAIVGVVADIRQKSLEAPVRPQLYLPASQSPDPARSLALVVATDARPEAILPRIRDAVRAAGPGLPLFAVQPMPEVVRDSLGGRRIAAAMMELFGGAVLILSLAGVYGIVSFSVSRRIREIGIRIALGATARSVLLLFLRESAATLGAGLAAGIALAAAAVQLLSAKLAGIARPGPILWGSAGLFLFLTTVATIVPAGRAARVDPMSALRNE